MTTGILTFLCLTLGQPANDTTYYNYRSLGLPVTYQPGRRGETREVLLYSSTDQGRSWTLAETIPSSKDQFAFHATRDGIYWLSVAMVDQQGKQQPDAKAITNGPPHLKIVIDTLQPSVRAIAAVRQGDEVVVNWDIQEDNPDRDGIKLEYQVKDANANTWTPIPGSYTHSGQARFRPGDAATLAIRLTVRDLAGNQSFALTEAAGTLATTGFSSASAGPSTNAKSDPPTLPGDGLTMPIAPMTAKPLEAFNPGPPAAAFDPLTGKPVEPARNSDRAPVSGPNAVTPKASLPTAPPGFGTAPPAPDGFGRTFSAPMPNSGSYAAPPPVPPQREPEVGSPVPRLAADSRDPGFVGSKTVTNSSPGRKMMPHLLYVNQHQITLEYELKRVGPSGVGEVELWLTKDDGANWERYAEDKDVREAVLNGRQKRTFDFRDLVTDQPFEDGIFGLILVVKNRAGVGRQPRAGDIPEIRVEIDKKPPLAQLYEPIADPHRPDHVLIMWNALDKNLAQAPVHLEYAATRDGPWQSIRLDLENKGRYPGKDRTGDFSWKVPTNIPAQVFLRLRVRDKAGNEGIAVTDRPHFVDLVEPEGALVGVHPATKQP